MRKPGRKPVDQEVIAMEARLLFAIWQSVDETKRGKQATFGETHGIGGQSAVGQFLRGDAPLSLKAAKGFAEGLGCQISDFSPRLAALATAWPFDLIDRERYESLSPAMRHKAQVRMDDYITELLEEQAFKANVAVR